MNVGLAATLAATPPGWLRAGVFLFMRYDSSDKAEPAPSITSVFGRRVNNHRTRRLA